MIQELENFVQYLKDHKPEAKYVVWQGIRQGETLSANGKMAILVVIDEKPFEIPDKVKQTVSEFLRTYDE